MSAGVRVESILAATCWWSSERRCGCCRSGVHDINHLLRPAHLASLKSIVEDPEASTTTSSSPMTF